MPRASFPATYPLHPYHPIPGPGQSWQDTGQARWMQAHLSAPSHWICCLQVGGQASPHPSLQVLGSRGAGTLTFIESPRQARGWGSALHDLRCAQQPCADSGMARMAVPGSGRADTLIWMGHVLAIWQYRLLQQRGVLQGIEWVAVRLVSPEPHLRLLRPARESPP